MVVFAEEDLRDPDVFVAVGVVVAVAAGPGGEGLVGALHEEGVGVAVGGGFGFVGTWGGGGGGGGGCEEGEEEGEEGERGVHCEYGFIDFFNLGIRMDLE